MSIEFLSEPFAIQDVYASGLSHVEDLGDGNYRFTFYTRQASIYGRADAVVVCRLIMPINAVHDGVRETLLVTGLASTTH